MVYTIIASREFPEAFRYEKKIMRGKNMAKTEAMKRAQARYEAKPEVKARTKGYYLKCHVEHDKDIIEKLESVEAVNTYIKELIRKDIAAQS